jgi:hypothetical protein
MPITFNIVLRNAGIQPSDVRLLRHRDSSAEKGKTPFELWRDDRAAFNSYQRVQEISNRVRFGDAIYWASFTGLDNGDTLFVGLYRCHFAGPLQEDTPKPHMQGLDVAGSLHVYDLVHDEALAEFEGKLVIDWGSGTRSWIQRADNQDKVVCELRRVLPDPAFPGYAEFILPLSRVPGLPARWQDALRCARGVYLLTCPRTREQYVGSAAGENGLLGRWLEYFETGHGGNKELKSRERSDYQISILEIAASTATVEEIIQLENRWKMKLQSRDMGLNRN